MLPPLTPELHAIFSGFLRERVGLHYGADDAALLGDKLSVCAEDAGFASLLDYYYHLRYDDAGAAALTALAEALVVHESYLFREHPPLVLAADLAAEAVARGERPRIWSAACAGGEEPATLAMLLTARGCRQRVDLIASDLSARVLARARTGTWTRRGLRQVPEPELAERYLTVDARAVRIEPALIADIDWRQINLIVPDQVASVGLCDVILCRNVLIYFDDDTVLHVVESLGRQLRPGGVLLIGVAESLLRFPTSLVCEEHRGVFLYRRPLSP
jgi:chemotaxis protein methyltransferase CheR